GKTTVSTALALAAARRGKRVLIAMCNAKERVSKFLEVEPIGAYNQPVLPGIDAVNMVPKIALEESGLMVLKVRALYRAIFENRLVAAFLRGTPGIEAWSMLGKAQFHAHEMLPDGRPRYDLVILDSPATGHGLEMLRVPRVLLDVAPPGLLRREAERAWDLFTDPVRSGVMVVTLPEEMPVSESVELYDALRNELGLPVVGIAVNGMIDQLFDQSDSAWIEQVAAETPEDDLVYNLLRAGRRRTLRERVQAESLARIAASLPLPRYSLSQLMVPELKRAGIEQLSHAFDV
ncbi:MAG: Arsenical pump-driving ATPase, partial [Myxococcaceae bacterium]|nr:Arsenical pump-driving ATPase [Myxococcaceae bacterium]